MFLFPHFLRSESERILEQLVAVSTECFCDERRRWKQVSETSSSDLFTPLIKRQFRVTVYHVLAASVWGITAIASLDETHRSAGGEEKKNGTKLNENLSWFSCRMYRKWILQVLGTENEIYFTAFFRKYIFAFNLVCQTSSFLKEADCRACVRRSGYRDSHNKVIKNFLWLRRIYSCSCGNNSCEIKSRATSEMRIIIVRRDGALMRVKSGSFRCQLSVRSAKSFFLWKSLCSAFMNFNCGKFPCRLFNRN